MRKRFCKKLMTKRSLLVIVVMVVFISHFSSFPVRAAVNVGVLPFTAAGDTELSFLGDGIREIISSRIGLPGKLYVLEESKVTEAMEERPAELDAETARSIGYQLDADFLIVGEIVSSKTLVTIRGKILPLKKESSPVSFFREWNNLDAVIPSASGLAEELRQKILKFDGEQAASPANRFDEDVQSLQEERIFPGEAAGKVPHETPELGPALSQPPLSSGEESARSLSQERGKISLNHWRSNSISHALRGLAVGDADGDGKKEIVCITGKKIVVYQKEGDEIRTVTEHTGDKGADFLKIDMTDADGNGIDEIFLTDRGSDALSSLVLEYSTDGFQTKVPATKWSFAVADYPEEGSILLGQVRGAESSAEAQIQRMRWDGEAYVSSGLADAPPDIDLHWFGVLGITHSEEQEFVSLDNEGRVLVYDGTGKVTWQSKDRFTGSLVDLSSSSPASSGIRADDGDSAFPLRLITKDLNNDQENDIILGRNFAKDKGFIRRKSVFEGGAVYGLHWNGYDMDTRWQTERLDEIVLDYCVGDADNDGNDELIIAVRGGKSRLTLRPKYYILIYEIS